MYILEYDFQRCLAMLAEDRQKVFHQNETKLLIFIIIGRLNMKFH